MLAQPLANEPAFDILTKLDLSTTALLFDVDGTLIDIGPAPYDVFVPETLPATLRRLYERTGGAVALVSGRPVHDLDQLFAPLVLPAIGGHGAEVRQRMGETPARAEDLPDDLRRHLAKAAPPGSGVVIEDKGYSVTLHYRMAPKEAERLRKYIASGRAAFPKDTTELLVGKAMFEVRRPGTSKGQAVRNLMSQPPFAGRVPVFVGDDVTDESVFDILPSIGGKGFGVGRHFPGARGIFRSPADVRAALHQLSANG
jgi:trehalose 6-phosphate phosphatase